MMGIGHTNEEFLALKNLAGNVTKEQFSTVDWYVHYKVGLVLPATGPCFSRAIIHQHPSYSFILHFDDLYQLETKNKIINTQQNTFTALSPGIEHRESSSEKFVRYAAIFVDRKFFEDQLSFYDGIESNIIFTGNNYKALPPLKSAIKDFMLEYENLLPGREQLLNAIEFKIAHALIRCIFNLEENNHLINQRTNIDNVIEYIHGHYGERLTIGELADVANLSESHFIRVFKESTGKTPKEYLLLIRLDKAKKMLRNSNKKNTEIALDCGFNNSSHFSNTFQKYFNISPLKYKSALE